MSKQPAMTDSQDENLIRAELTEIDKMIVGADRAIKGMTDAYEKNARPDLVGAHRSIWSADAKYRDPFTLAVIERGKLIPQGRALRDRMQKLTGSRT